MRSALFRRVFALAFVLHLPDSCVRASETTAALGLTATQQTLLDASPENKEAVRSDGRIVVQGAGASFPKKLYSQVISAYTLYNPSVDVSYVPISSGSGRCRLTNYFDECKESDIPSPYFVDFAGSDSLVNEATYEAYPDIQMYPAVAGAVIPIFNIPGVSELVITPMHLSLIFMGSLTMWNDARIVNDQVSNTTRTILANTQQPIQVVVRSDKRGHTGIFKTALASFDDGTFENVVGTSSEGTWGPNVFTMRGSSDGMNSAVFKTPYTIGYSVLGEVMHLNVGVVVFRKVDSKGKVSVVYPSTESVQNAVAEKGSDYGNNGEDSTRMTSDVSNANGNNAWPMTGYTYFVLRKNTMRPFSDCRNRRATLDFLIWFFEKSVPSQLAKDAGFAALPVQVRTNVANALKRQIYCEENVPAYVSPELAWPKVIASGASELGTVLELYLKSYKSKNPETVIPHFDSHSGWAFDHENGVLKEDGVAFVMGRGNTLEYGSKIDGTVSFPFAAFGISLIYNLCAGETVDCVNPELVLTPKVAAQLMNGSIKKWNHVSLARLNPDAGLESLDLDVTVVMHRQPEEDQPSSMFALSGAEHAFAEQIRELSGLADFEIGFTSCSTAKIAYAFGDVENLSHTVYAVAGSVAVYARTKPIGSDASVAKLTLTESPADAISLSLSTLQACFDPEFDPTVPCYPITGTVYMVTNMEPKLTVTVPPTTPDNAEMLTLQSCNALLGSISIINWLYTSVRYPHLSSFVSSRLESLNIMSLMIVIDQNEERRVEMVEQLFSVTCNGESLLYLKEEKNFIDSAFLSVGLGLVGLSYFVYTIFGLMLWSKRKSLVVKSSSPFFMAEVLFGATLVMASVVSLSMQDDIFSPRSMGVACSTIPWLFGIGYALMFSALTLKTWRLVTLFNNKKMKKLVISTKGMVKFQCTVMVLVILLLFFWQITDPFRWERETVRANSMGDVLESVGYCTCNNFGVSAGPLGAVLGVLTMYGMYITFRSRDLPDQFGEAKYLALAMLTIVEGMVAGVPMLYIAGDNATVQYFAKNFMILVISFGTVVIMFVPKFLKAITEVTSKLTSKLKKSGGVSGSSRIAPSSSRAPPSIAHVAVDTFTRVEQE